jgi:hypothetical protein
MAKPLTRPQKESSVSNMLDVNVGAAALSTPSQREPTRPTPVTNDIAPQSAQNDTTGEPANIHRQFILTESTDETLKKIVKIYSKATGIDLKASEVMRAVLIALDHAAPELEREATHIGPLKRPKNERGKEALRDELERRIARALIAGARAANILE